jgi:hypothetical protein
MPTARLAAGTILPLASPALPGLTQPRSSHTSLAYNGYMYTIGGHSPTSGADCTISGTSGFNCNGVQYAPLYSPEQGATYEKLVDIGSSAVVTGISFNGRAVCGMQINYRIGDSSGVYGATTTIPYGLPGATYSFSQTGRYVWVQFKMDDSTCGTRSQITDFTVTYNVPPAAPTLSAPSGGATGVTATPQFQLRTTDADNDYLEYWIDVCSTSNCSSVVRSICQQSTGTNVPGTCTASQTGWSGQDQQTSTAYTGNSVITSSTTATHVYQFAPLAASTQYWWRAYAIDPGGTNIWSSASSIATFTTGNDVPAAPTLLRPINNSSGTSVLTTFNLRSTDLNSDYLKYWIDVCADSGCSSIIRSICQQSTGTNVPGTCTASQTGWAGQDAQAGTAYSSSYSISSSQLATHNFQLPYLAANTQYWWRAYAIDPGGTNTWSSASSIGTFNTAPTETHIQGSVNLRGNVRL